jgi:uncharacterized membrane protein YsdA (DUF1294 family)/cold shock CspA family protein
MRHKGRITNWNDARGFGFVVPSAGGSRAFLHISSLLNRNRRPAENDLVTFRLATDSKGRPQAVEVEFVGDRPKPPRDDTPVWGALAVAAVFFGSLLSAVAMGVYPAGIFAIYFVASTLAFVMYWYDKAAAQRSRWRTAEGTLHAVGLLGGWPGALVAMQVFRHKSRKASFRKTFWVMVLMNCSALVGLASPGGAKALAWIQGVV